MELYLHIGTEKTGTSSVQNFLAANRARLAHMGILYPETPGAKNHTGLAAAAQDVSDTGPLRKTLGLQNQNDVEAYRAKLIEGLKEEYRGGAFKTVIMSNEHCSSRLLREEEVHWLKDILAPHFEKIRIVVYLRRQDDYLLSIYSTAVKSGSVRPLEVPPLRSAAVRYDYWPFLSRWARVFGRDAIVCRKFERATLKNGDVIDDLLSLIGVEADSAFERPGEANESLDAETLEFLRMFNAHVSRFAGNRLNPIRANIVGLLSAISSGPLVTLEEEQLRGFMGMFEESNRKVALEYFGGVREAPGDPLFDSRSDTRERTAPVTLSVERAVEIAAHLWQEKQSQVERVKGRDRRQGHRKDRGAAATRKRIEL
ncbi:MAG TPA: hypothetical protein VHE09_01480 [Rhizomicrobium sp.]|nr:hypothetical protein [Rhizomicrobium sp.]